MYGRHPCGNVGLIRPPHGIVAGSSPALGFQDPIFHQNERKACQPCSRAVSIRTGTTQSGHYEHSSFREESLFNTGLALQIVHKRAQLLLLHIHNQ
jgi:hypothetical protein